MSLVPINPKTGEPVPKAQRKAWFERERGEPGLDRKTAEQIAEEEEAKKAAAAAAEKEKK